MLHFLVILFYIKYEKTLQLQKEKNYDKKKGFFFFLSKQATGERQEYITPPQGTSLKVAQKQYSASWI